MLKAIFVALSLALTGAAFAQYTQPDTSAGTPSPPPNVAPPATPSVIGGPPPALGGGPVGGLSRCENLLLEKDRCLQEERSAAAGGTAPRPPANPAPATGAASGTAAPENTAPSGTVR